MVSVLFLFYFFIFLTPQLHTSNLKSNRLLMTFDTPPPHFKFGGDFQSFFNPPPQMGEALVLYAFPIISNLSQASSKCKTKNIDFPSVLKIVLLSIYEPARASMSSFKIRLARSTVDFMFLDVPRGLIFQYREKDIFQRYNEEKQYFPLE